MMKTKRAKRVERGTSLVNRRTSGQAAPVKSHFENDLNPRTHSPPISPSLHLPLSPSPHPRHRQGILLLVVLSMLTLFLLIGTAFIVSANHYRQTNKILAKLTETSNSSIDQRDLLNEVINQIVRDTHNQNSTLRFHSLLRDMYGNDGLLAAIEQVEWATESPGNGDNFTNGQLLQFSLQNITDQFGSTITPQNLSQVRNAYNGLVLTFLDGEARGQSVRIVGYFPGSTAAVFRVMTPRLADGTTLTTPNGLQFSQIAINGRPFNGLGSGYSLAAPAGSARLVAGEALRSDANPSNSNSYLPVALMPNGAFFNPNNLRPADYLGAGTYPGATQLEVWDNLTQFQKSVLNGFNFGGRGSCDESYDAADFQNMMLASMQTNPIETILPGQPIDWSSLPNWPARLSSLGSVVLPSFHRPALLNYWASLPAFKSATDPVTQSTLGLPANVSLLRKILLRPNWHDHPNFTGSNPDFANLSSHEDRLTRMIYGPWDVDNDNDGIRDSMWVDFGAPVMENSDGRLVKPMAAILVLDMDGRLNLNAHGSEDVANPGNFGLPIAGTDTSLLPTDPSRIDSNDLPHGQGFGPAEISLAPLMPLPGGAATMNSDARRAARWVWYRRYFRGAARNTDILPADIAAIGQRRRFSRDRIGKFGGDSATVGIEPGTDGFDIAAQLKMQDVPRWADGNLLNTTNTANPVLGGFATPPDYRGRYGLGLNEFGQPVHESLVEIGINGRQMDFDTPYELDLSLGAARGETFSAPDGPYTLAELERVLRAYDPDSGTLSSRIWDMAGEFKDSSMDTTPNLDKLNLWRRIATTDSYDLPVPNVVVPEWMHLGPDGLPGPQGSPAYDDDFQAVMGRPPVGLSFTDLLEYRIRIAPHTADPMVAPITGVLNGGSITGN